MHCRSIPSRIIHAYMSCLFLKSPTHPDLIYSSITSVTWAAVFGSRFASFWSQLGWMTARISFFSVFSLPRRLILRYLFFSDYPENS